MVNTQRKSNLSRLPLSRVNRLEYVLFPFNPQVLFQLALTILEANKQRLLACHDDGEAMTVLSVYFERVVSRDISSSNMLLEKTVEQRKQRERTNNAPDVVS